MSLLDPLDDISSALVGLVPEVEVEIRGEWTTTHRRTYEREAQTGSGLGPFVDIEDMRWRAKIECSTPLTGIAFLRTAREICWVKAGRPVERPLVEVSLHVRANYVDGRATFSSNLMGSVLPGIPVAFSGNVETSCKLGHSRFMTGRAQVVATAGEGAFVVILLPRTVIKMGRNNLWHLRDEFAASLPDHVRPVLTRGRTGALQAHEQDAG